MRVYRIEHRSNTLGPYSGDDRVEGMGAAHTDDKHPSPWEDSVPVQRFIKRHAWETYAVHGLDSLDNLYKWFEGWENKLIQNGYVIRVFEVPLGSYRRGKQVVFRRDKARMVETVEIQKTHIR